MNVIIFSAIWGVLMMYVGFATKNKNVPTYVAIAGLLLMLTANWMEYIGINFFAVDTKGMLEYD